jgi:hypothetical protein
MNTPKEFPTLASAARALVSMAAAEAKTYSVRASDGSTPSAEEVLKNWHEVQSGEDDVAAMWTQPATIEMNSIKSQQGEENASDN